MSKMKCEFNSEEPCHPLACLVRAEGAVNASEAINQIPIANKGGDEIVAEQEQIFRILITVRNCAYDKVLALKNKKLVKE